MPNKIVFVVMPWHSIHYPSLGVGILNTIAHQEQSDVSTKTIFGNILWAQFLTERTAEKIGPNEYRLLGEDLFFRATGEWIFTPAFYGVDEWKVEEYRSYFGDNQDFQAALVAHRMSGEFVDYLCDELLATDPDIVALTSVFQQNMPCLALAKRIKQRRPDVKTIMGGGNCDGPQGAALHRNFSFLDFVVRGEGEQPFRDFIHYLDGRKSLEDIPNLCWRSHDGQSVVNPMGPRTSPRDFVTPTYPEYFEQAMNSSIAHHIEPNIIAESSRGCWWGQKHHCTFCGLNGTGMEFRSKRADDFVNEIRYLTKKHKSLDIILSDNILDMAYLTTVLPQFADLDWDLRLHYEIKANFRRDQLEKLRDAGVWHIQPGIESLSTNTLKLMRKGTTGTQNVKLLRECEELNLTTSWNILMGFPGESLAEYEAIRKQLPALAHLQPPSSATRIAVERFSPYYNDQSLGFSNPRPASCYSLIYELPENELFDIVYVFDVPPQGASDDIIGEMQAEVRSWRTAYEDGSSLIKHEVQGGILIRDRRTNWESRDIFLSDAVEAPVYRELSRPQKSIAIIKSLEERGLEVSELAVAEILAKFTDEGLVFTEDDNFIALATADIPFRIRLSASA
jgi:ribosomal peptide maturation radical SAM protein 1